MKWTWTRIAHSGPIWRKRWDSNPRAREGYLISSQARYDHFDTLPYMLTRFREVNAIFSFIRIFIRTRHAAKLLICREPAWLKALWGFDFSKKRNISSAAPSTSRTTLRVYFNPIFTAKNHSKKFWGEKQERKQKTIRFLILKTLLYQGFPADETTKLP